MFSKSIREYLTISIFIAVTSNHATGATREIATSPAQISNGAHFSCGVFNDGDSVEFHDAADALVIDAPKSIAGIDLNGFDPTGDITVTANNASLGSVGNKGTGAGINIKIGDGLTFDLTGIPTDNAVVPTDNYSGVASVIVGSTIGGAPGTTLNILNNGGGTPTTDININSFPGATANKATVSVTGNYLFRGELGASSALKELNANGGSLGVLGTVVAPTINITHQDAAYTLWGGTTTGDIFNTSGALGTTRVEAKFAPSTLHGSIGTALNPLSGLYFQEDVQISLNAKNGNRNIYASIKASADNRGTIFVTTENANNNSVTFHKPIGENGTSIKEFRIDDDAKAKLGANVMALYAKTFTHGAGTLEVLGDTAIHTDIYNMTSAHIDADEHTITVDGADLVLDSDIIISAKYEGTNNRVVLDLSNINSFDATMINSLTVNVDNNGLNPAKETKLTIMKLPNGTNFNRTMTLGTIDAKWTQINGSFDLIYDKSYPSPKSLLAKDPKEVAAEKILNSPIINAGDVKKLVDLLPINILPKDIYDIMLHPENSGVSEALVDELARVTASDSTKILEFQERVNTAPKIASDTTLNFVTSRLNLVTTPRFDIPFAPQIGVSAGENDEPSKLGIWGEGNIAFARQKQSGPVSGFKYNSRGFTVGADAMTSEQGLIGFVASNNLGKIKHQNNGNTTNANSMVAGIYGNYNFRHNWFMRGALILNNTRIHNKEKRVKAGGYGIAEAKYNMVSYGGEIVLGFNQNMRNMFTLTPSAGLRIIHNDKISYKEKGNTAQNNKFSQNAQENYIGLLGLEASKRIRLSNGVILLPEAHVNLQYGIDRKSPNGSFISPLSPNLTNNFVGNKPTKLTTTYGLSLAALGEKVEYAIRGEASVAPGYTLYQAALKVRVKL